MAKSNGRAPYLRGTPSERFWPKVNKAGPVPDYAPHLGPCWLWTAALTVGYGTFKLEQGKATVRAHRFAYQELVGPIPNGLHLDHLCRVTACVRPDHLEPVTSQENTRRGFVAEVNRARLGGRERCLRDLHDFTPENTIIDHVGKRACRECTNIGRRANWTGRPTCKYGHPFTDLSTAPYCANGHEMTAENTAVRRDGRRDCRTCNREKAQRSRARKAERQAAL